jgi:hypothetical protein
MGHRRPGCIPADKLTQDWRFDDDALAFGRHPLLGVGPERPCGCGLRHACENMAESKIFKYPDEYVLEFRSVDRFLFRASDLDSLDKHIRRPLLDRLDNCHIYFLGKRPRLSIVPSTIEIANDIIRFMVEYKLKGTTQVSSAEILRSQFLPEEVVFESSPYPHRELITRDQAGEVVAHTLLANSVHLMSGIQQIARDLEIMYIGKGLHKSARDRLASHTTLQKVLTDINSNTPDDEIFVLVYAFDHRKNLLRFLGMPTAITGDTAMRRRKKVIAYRPSLDKRISLIEATCISYYKPEYNVHHRSFPNRPNQMLKPVYEADFAAIAVQVDHTNIGGQRIYSQHVQASSTHYVVVDFRRPKYLSILSQLPNTCMGITRRANRG